MENVTPQMLTKINNINEFHWLLEQTKDLLQILENNYPFLGDKLQKEMFDVFVEKSESMRKDMEGIQEVIVREWKNMIA